MGAAPSMIPSDRIPCGFWFRARAEPVLSSSPLGGDGGGKAQRPIECVAEPTGGWEAMPGSPARGGGNPRSALTGPLIAALTGVPCGWKKPGQLQRSTGGLARQHEAGAA